MIYVLELLKITRFLFLQEGKNINSAEQLIIFDKSFEYIRYIELIRKEENTYTICLINREEQQDFDSKV